MWTIGNLLKLKPTKFDLVGFKKSVQKDYFLTTLVVVLPFSVCKLTK